MRVRLENRFSPNLENLKQNFPKNSIYVFWRKCSAPKKALSAPKRFMRKHYSERAHFDQLKILSKLHSSEKSRRSFPQSLRKFTSVTGLKIINEFTFKTRKKVFHYRRPENRKVAENFPNILKKHFSHFLKKIVGV